jgi:hypothetical protein
MIYFQCPHCGNYKIDRDACDDLSFNSKKRSELGHILSHLARRVQSTTGTKWASITPEKIQKLIETGSLPSPQEQAEYLLHWLGSNLPGPGEAIKLTWKEHGAIIGSKSSEGFAFIINGLVSEGLIPQGVTINPDAEASVTLSFKGWHKFEELQRGSTTGRKAFMAMPYGKPEIDNIVDNYFRIAVQKTGFDLKRLDDVPKAGLIDDRLRVEIKTSRFLIADLTFDNNGAYWEAGYAEGLGKPVIYTCTKEHFDKGTHFDTNHHLTVIWDKDEPEKAANLLKATIRATFPDAKTDEE